MSEATKEEIDRFMSKVDKLPNGCWFWTGGRSRGKGNKKWYGSFWFRGKTIRAHRFAADFIGKFEPLPRGKHRDHLCVFSMCVNPEHLEHTTSSENQERKIERAMFQGPKLPGPMKEARVQHASMLNPFRQRALVEELEAQKAWPFNEPDEEPGPIETACYGVGGVMDY